jgi:LPS-assembly protein
MNPACLENLNFWIRRGRHLGGAAIVAIAVTMGFGAHAQVIRRSPAPPPAPASIPRDFEDDLGLDGFYIEADLLIRDDKNSAFIAKGDVEARYHGRVVRAQEIDYDRSSGKAMARGKVTIIDPDGGVQTADQVLLDQDMRAGLAKGFAARMPDGSQIAAQRAERKSDQIDELNHAIFTPCQICADEPNRAPTWSVRADTVTEDHAKHMIYYRNAVIQLFGMPVIFLPVFAHPDPQAPAKSGLLVPRIGYSKRRGASYEQPYLKVLSSYSDIVISPQFNTNINPFLNVDYRRRIYSGAIDIRGGYTYEQDVDGKGRTFGPSMTRSYILARGKFEISPEWQWGFSAERASDDLIFDKYDIAQIYTQRGLFNSEDHRLLSQLFALRQGDGSFLSISAISVQGLRPGDDDRTFPTIAPLIEARFEPKSPVLGGRLRLRGSAVMLTREQSPTNPIQPGTDSGRASVNLDWRSDITLQGGLHASPFVQTRVDAYSLSDLGSAARAQSMNVSRGEAVAGIDLSLPLIKGLSGGSMILEPIAQLAASPRSDPIQIGRIATGEPIYFNEDSFAFEFDETNLFRANKFPGFDLYEGGQRLNTGVRATVRYDNGATGTLLVGRSFRAARDDIFSLRTGLRPQVSDWVVAGQASYAGVDLFVRSRLDSVTGAVRRLETGADVANRFGNGSIRYLRDRLDISGVKLENLDARGQVNLTPRLAVSLYGSRDLHAGVWRRRNIGMVYDDDCARIELIYQYEDQFTNTPAGRTLRANESVVLRLTLATLGGTRYGQ